MINKDFFQAIEDLDREKGIKQEVLLDTLKHALVFAYKKHTGDSSDVYLDLNPEKKSVRFFLTAAVSISPAQCPGRDRRQRTPAAPCPVPGISSVRSEW